MYVSGDQLFLATESELRRISDCKIFATSILNIFNHVLFYRKTFLKTRCSESIFCFFFIKRCINDVASTRVHVLLTTRFDDNKQLFIYSTMRKTKKLVLFNFTREYVMVFFFFFNFFVILTTLRAVVPALRMDGWVGEGVRKITDQIRVSDFSPIRRVFGFDRARE